jgi:hypothetical protein
MTSQPFHEGLQRSLQVASPKRRLLLVNVGGSVTVSGREDGLSIVSSFTIFF